jgi:hypothetical protein
MANYEERFEELDKTVASESEAYAESENGEGAIGGAQNVCPLFADTDEDIGSTISTVRLRPETAKEIEDEDADTTPAWMRYLPSKDNRRCNLRLDPAAPAASASSSVRKPVAKGRASLKQTSMRDRRSTRVQLRGNPYAQNAPEYTPHMEDPGKTARYRKRVNVDEAAKLLSFCGVSKD